MAEVNSDNNGGDDDDDEDIDHDDCKEEDEVGDSFLVFIVDASREEDLIVMI